MKILCRTNPIFLFSKTVMINILHFVQLLLGGIPKTAAASQKHWASYQWFLDTPPPPLAWANLNPDNLPTWTSPFNTIPNQDKSNEGGGGTVRGDVLKESCHD